MNEALLKIISINLLIENYRHKKEMNVNPWGKNSGKKRDRFSIITDILEIAKKGAAKTRIMYNANLSFAQINQYLEFLLEVNLLTTTIQNARKLYSVTEKGNVFLERSHEIMDLIRNEEGRKNIRVPPLQLLTITR